jgi:protocatechuate 3,4-dioxygenase beta subunit
VVGVDRPSVRWLDGVQQWADPLFRNSENVNISDITTIDKNRLHSQEDSDQMNQVDLFLTRRGLLRGGLTLGAAAYFTSGAFAEQLSRTPRVGEGPFYPPKMPLDTDNDLLVLNNNITPAVGEVAHLSGRVLSPSGEPFRNAVVEIWQCDNTGIYIAQDDKPSRDANFQGFGRFLTGSTGEYYFRTIKPVPYGNRTPHIHMKVKNGGRELLTTQLFINGHPLNTADRGVGEIRGPVERELVLVDFKPIKESKIGELSARIDIVVGLTPDESRPRRRESIGDR